MDFEDAGLGADPVADSWTDFFSAEQAEDPVLPSPSLMAAQQAHQQTAVSQLMAAEPVDPSRESFSVQELVQGDVITRIQQAQRRSALLSFKELVQYQRAKRLHVLSTPRNLSRAPKKGPYMPFHRGSDEAQGYGPSRCKMGKSNSGAYTPPPSIIPAKPPTILRLASAQVDPLRPFRIPSCGGEPRQPLRMPALAEIRTPLLPEMLPLRSSLGVSEAHAAPDLAKGSPSENKLTKVVTLEQPVDGKVVIAGVTAKNSRAGSRGVLGEVKQHAELQPPEAFITMVQKPPEGRTPISPLRF